MIDQTRTFGAAFGAPAAAATAPASNDAPKAEIWANIGYEVDSADGKYSFVSLPFGVAIDTMKHKPITSRDPVFASFQGACNQLLDDVNAAVAVLQPGESKIYGERGSLQLQIRRVDNSVVAPTAAEQNMFAAPLAL